MKLIQAAVAGALGNAAMSAIKVCPVTLSGGAKAFVDPLSIPQSDFTDYHGKTLDGADVHTASVGKIVGTMDVAIKHGEGYFTMPLNDFEVMCAGAAKDLGYKVEKGALRP